MNRAERQITKATTRSSRNYGLLPRRNLQRVSPASDASLPAASLRVVCFRLLPCRQRDHLSLRLDARQLAGSVAFGTRRRQFQSGLYSGSPGLYEEILTAVPVEHKHSVIPCLAGD